MEARGGRAKGKRLGQIRQPLGQAHYAPINIDPSFSFLFFRRRFGLADASDATRPLLLLLALFSCFCFKITKHNKRNWADQNKNKLAVEMR